MKKSLTSPASQGLQRIAAQVCREGGDQKCLKGIFPLIYVSAQTVFLKFATRARAVWFRKFLHAWLMPKAQGNTNASHVRCVRRCLRHPACGCPQAVSTEHAIPPARRRGVHATRHSGLNGGVFRGIRRNSRRITSYLCSHDSADKKRRLGRQITGARTDGGRQILGARRSIFGLRLERPIRRDG